MSTPTTPASVRRDADRKEAPRERTRNFGGPRQKLAVIGSIEGMHLYWENDDNGAIEQLLADGFRFVEPSEVQMQSHTVVADSEISNKISRYVGRKEDGTPMRAYLMCCTEEHWAERESNRYAQADAWDSAIRRGQVEPDSGRYIPKGTGTSLETNSPYRNR